MIPTQQWRMSYRKRKGGTKDRARFTMYAGRRLYRVMQRRYEMVFALAAIDPDFVRQYLARRGLLR